MQSLPFFATVADRVAWARRRYFDQGERPSGLVAEPLFQSWQRCLTAGLRPQDGPDFDPVTRARVNHALARNHALIEAADAQFDQLDAMLAATGCRTLLIDDRGIVLRATPPAAAGRDILDVAARVGVQLEEKRCGSTAPAVCASSGAACTVLGAEHFFGMLQRIQCAAAPIHSPAGNLVGVLDLSIEGRPFGFDAFAIVKLAAAAIENRLAVLQAPDHLKLHFQISAELLRTPMQGLALVDGRGRLTWVNPAGRSLLAPAAADVEAGLGLTLQQLLAHGPEPRLHRLPSGLAVHVAVDAPGRHAPAAPVTPTLRELGRQHVESALAACGGNVAAAARRLGVSRGLLYRRLRERAPVTTGS